MSVDLPLLYEGDRPTLAERRVPSQFRRLPRWRGVVRGQATGSQMVEDLALELLTGTTLDLATGANLDQWASIVGQQRLDLTDDELRGFIKARVISNVGQGVIDDMIRIAEHTCSPLAVWYRDLFPAGFTVYVLRASWMRETRRQAVRRLFDEAAPAGVTPHIVEVLIGYLGLQPDSSSTELTTAFAAYGPRAIGIGALAREV